MHPSRRQFVGSAAAAALAPLAPGIKISLQVPGEFTADDLVFARQMGLEYVSVPGTGGTYEKFAEIKRRVEAGGLKVANIGNASVHNMPEVTLNLPGRDAKIEAYKQYLRDLARAGVFYTTYAHMGNGIWSSPPETARGGAPARAFHQATARGNWMGKAFEGSLTHGRRYTPEEIWENYTYFIRQVVPVAEQTGVRIGIHPDDPPVPELGGVPRCIFSNIRGYRRALQIAASPNVGVCLCCGTWLEGGKHTGCDVVTAIREFARMGKLWKIHLRNVRGSIPDFVEEYMDSGDADMRQLVRALVASDFRGILIADHVPQMAGERRAGWAYSIGYIKALCAMARG
jgi:mannonate dehydratase